MPKYFCKQRMEIAGKVYDGTPQNPVEVVLPSDVFFVTAPRFIDGRYIHANPEQPGEIRLPEGALLDRGLIPEHPPEAKPHYVPGKTSTAPSSAEHFGKTKGKRPSDSEPV